MKTTADFVRDELRRQKDLPSVRAPFQPEDWERSAACAPFKGDNGGWDGHWDLFFQPEGLHGGRPKTDVQREAEAKSLCAWCPVREMCRKKADDNDERFGIWAGVDRDPSKKSKTPAERESRPPRARRWADMTEEQRDRARARSRAYRAARRATSRSPEPKPAEERRAATREASRRWRERLRADPVAHQAHKDRRNEAYRLSKQNGSAERQEREAS